MTFADVKALAESSGARIESGINWTWARGFTNELVATIFHDDIVEAGYETRGVYPLSDNGNPNLVDWGVRFR